MFTLPRFDVDIQYVFGVREQAFNLDNLNERMIEQHSLFSLTSDYST